MRGLESGCADECETPRRCYGVRVALHTPCAMLTTAQGGAEVGGRTATTTLKCGVVAPGEAVRACRNLIADALGRPRRCYYRVEEAIIDVASRLMSRCSNKRRFEPIPSQ